MGGRFQDCPLGIAGTSKENPGSGNCAWTARRFLTWANTKGYAPVQIVLFPHTSEGSPFRNTDRAGEGESSAHIVPVYQETIIDYIQAFTNGMKYQTHKVANLTVGKHALQEGGPQMVNYGSEYDFYIVGNSLHDINSIMSQEVKQRTRVNTFDRPRPSLAPNPAVNQTTVPAQLT